MVYDYRKWQTILPHPSLSCVDLYILVFITHHTCMTYVAYVLVNDRETVCRWTRHVCGMRERQKIKFYLLWFIYERCKLKGPANNRGTANRYRQVRSTFLICGSVNPWTKGKAHWWMMLISERKQKPVDIIVDETGPDECNRLTGWAET